MRLRLPLLLLCCASLGFAPLRAPSFALGASSFATLITADIHESLLVAKGGQSPLETFLTDFDFPTASQQAEDRLRRDPHDTAALFVRMEAAELQERPDL